VHAEIEAGRTTPTVAADIDAMIVWMNEVPFVPGKSYWFKQTTRTVTGSMAELRHAVDVNTLAQKPANKLNLNEVGRVSLALSQPLVFDPYKTNPATGAFIVIDRLTNNTVGAGMIIGRHSTGRDLHGRVSQQEKEARLGQRGKVLWISEKLADNLERALFEEARTVARVDAADLSGAHASALLKVLADQALIVLISARDTNVPADLKQSLGTRLIVVTETDTEKALALISHNEAAAADDALEGQDI
jgi:hypothetical protein